MLPEDLQVMFLLRHGLELSYEEIAQAFDIPVGSVKSSMFRIRKRLKEVIGSRLRREAKVLSNGGRDR